jgi:signal transduction histidine kinase
MQSFGGGLRIESTVGEGTTVTMRFPGIRGRVHDGVSEAASDSHAA